MHICIHLHNIGICVCIYINIYIYIFYVYIMYTHDKLELMGLYMKAMCLRNKMHQSASSPPPARPKFLCLSMLRLVSSDISLQHAPSICVTPIWGSAACRLGRAVLITSSVTFTLHEVPTVVTVLMTLNTAGLKATRETPSVINSHLEPQPYFWPRFKKSTSTFTNQNPQFCRFQYDTIYRMFRNPTKSWVLAGSTNETLSTMDSHFEAPSWRPQGFGSLWSWASDPASKVPGFLVLGK